MATPDTHATVTTLSIQTRRPHKKVRTGCLTCKVRRKKCDEAKPSCRRCIAAHFTCDGYSNIVIAGTRSSKALSASDDENIEGARSRAHSRIDRMASRADMIETSSPATIGPRLTRSPNPLGELQHISDLEVHCYSFFRHKTVPQLATYFENCLWRVNLQNAALAVHHPALFKAATALGAVHRRFSYGISREAFEYCAHAARLYKSSTRSLHELKQSRDGHLDIADHLLLLTCETLLGIFQIFQADNAASAMHIQSGVKTAIVAPLRLLHSESWYSARPSPPRIICGLMYQLYCQATELFDEPTLSLSLDFGASYQDISIPTSFDSLKEMKNYLFGIVRLAWTCRPYVEDLSDRHLLIESFENRLHDWTSACLNTLNVTVIAEPEQVKAFNILNLTHSVLCVAIQGNMLMTGGFRMRPLAHLPIFASSEDDLSEAAAELRRAIDYMYSIERVDMSDIKTMFEKTIRKYNIFSFEQRSTGRTAKSDITEILNLWSIAKRASEIEEDAVIEAVRNVVPPGVLNVDIGEVWREQRRISVRYYVPDGAGYRWVQQFWAF